METSTSHRRFSTFISNPVVVIWGLVGSVASLLSIPLAIYFFVAAQDHPQLTFYVHPVKAVLVEAGQTSKLTASYEDKPIEGDVTTAQVAIWNQGRRSIKSGDVLKPVVLYTANNTPILEATLRKTSRDVTGFRLGTDELQKGRLALSWNILEYEDGAVIQLVYAGKPDVKIGIDGVVEGQKALSELTSTERIRTPYEQYNRAKFSNKVFGLYFLSTGILMLVFVLRRILRWRKWIKNRRSTISMTIDEVNQLLAGDEGKLKEFRGLEKQPPKSPRFPWPARITLLVYTTTAIVSFALSVYMLIIAQQPNPPFGF